MTVSRSNTGGRAYLDLRSEAIRQGRPFSEMLNLYALEGFLDRLSRSAHVGNLVLKGGVLLAAFDTRRATRDIDLQADALSNDARAVQKVIYEIAEVPVDDGLIFTTSRSKAEVIRDHDEYSGVRVSIPCQLETADVSFHVDVSVGDAIWPTPELIDLPRILGGEVRVRGYSIEMVIAEKVVTAIQRGTASTRWRDFCDIYLLSQSHTMSETTLRGALQRVSEGRGTAMAPFSEVVAGYEVIAQIRWSAWVRKQGLAERLPNDFGEVLSWIARFTDPILSAGDLGRQWDGSCAAWIAGV